MSSYAAMLILCRFHCFKYKKAENLLHHMGKFLSVKLLG